MSNKSDIHDEFRAMVKANTKLIDEVRYWKGERNKLARENRKLTAKLKSKEEKKNDKRKTKSK